MLGADLLLKALEEQGVDTVFGLPGGSVIPLYDRLKHFNIRHILTRHEQGAVHAADGYARATGKVGVCFATSGPAQPIWSQALPQLRWIRSLWSASQDRWSAVY